jgi:hypothetical protein
MAKTDPGLKSGNTPPPIALKFGKASDVFHVTERAAMAHALTAARQVFDDNAEQSVREWGEGPEGEYKVRITERAYSGEAQLGAAAATIVYRSAQREALGRLALYRPDDGSQQTTTLSSVLAVTFNPEASEPEILTFDFEAKDPVEELVRIGQNITGGDIALEVFQGTTLAMGIILGASQSVLS